MREVVEKVWRPLLMSEYPPPGPTKYGETRDDGTRPILVFAAPLPTAQPDSTR